jgi:hypothetical protein
MILIKYFSHHILTAIDKSKNYFMLEKIDKNTGINLYRGRVGLHNEEFEKKDLFHVPFNKRYFADTSRFSVHGQPYLYLGQSIYVIWEEMKRPKLDDLFISRFTIEEPLTVLDLTCNYKDCVCRCNTAEVCDKFKSIYTELLRIACSIRVKSKDDRKFKSEYVIPQLLMQLISLNSNIDGIKYYSENFMYESSNIFINYAFPAKVNSEEFKNSLEKGKFKNDKDNFSIKLVGNFNLSEPINLGLLNIDKTIANDSGYNKTAEIKLKKGYSINYENTGFYEYENKINTNKYFELGKLFEISEKKVD